MSTLSSVKTGTQAYRCRKALHSRRKPKDNMRGQFGDFSHTRLRIIEMIRRCRPNEKSGSCKKYSSFATYPGIKPLLPQHIQTYHLYKIKPAYSPGMKTLLTQHILTYNLYKI